MATSTTSFWENGELIEVSSSGEATSTITHRDEIELLRGKSKRAIADLYMRGIIDSQTFEDWCKGNDY